MLNKDFREFIESLNDNSVKYLVIGGYAVALHGHPRYTRDLDLWIQPEADNIQRLLQALEQFGFGGLGLKVDDFDEPDQVIQLGYPPNRIDLIFSASGVDFDQCHTSRRVIRIGVRFGVRALGCFTKGGAISPHSRLDTDARVEENARLRRHGRVA